MKNLLVLFLALLMALPGYGENYTPSQDAFQGNDIPTDTMLPFDEDPTDDDDPICPGEPMPDEDDEALNLQPPIPRPWPGRNRRWLCIAQGRRGGRGGNLFYSFARRRDRAVRQVMRRCRRQTFFRCRLFWCGRVSN